MSARTLSDYLALLPANSRGDANFVAFVSAILQPFVDAQTTILGFVSDFDIDNAVGAQLDAVGVRVGLSRVLPVPISGVYFALDTAGVGLDQGVILGPHDPTDALTSLDDGTYRLMLKIKVRANAWDGSLAQAQDVLAAIATAGTYLFIQDNFDMSVTVGVSGIVPSKLFVSLLRQTNDWLRPGGVALSVVVVTSINGAPIFGLDVENQYIAGLDVGALAIPY